MNQVTFIVFFVYSLAFFGMGIALLLETGRLSDPAQAKALRALAVFGILHGTHEWLESYMDQAASLGAQISSWMSWFRLSLLLLSYLALLVFAIRSLRMTSRGIPGKVYVLGGYFGLYAPLVLISAFATYRLIPPPWLHLLEGLIRYLVAVPTALLAANAALNEGKQFRQEKHSLLGNYFLLTALGFGVYSFTHLFVHPLDMAPARWVNSESFMAVTGFPIQAIRTLAAIVISYSLLRASLVMEEERKTALLSAQQARLEALQRQEALRRDLLTHTVHAQEEERARIARELHDETSQVLSAFSLELAALRSMLKRQKNASLKVEQLQNLSRQVSQGIYRLVRDLRPAQLDDLGLVAALRYLIGQYYMNAKITIAFKVSGDVRRLDSLVETILFRVAQEALTNTARHAETQQAQLELCFEENHIRLKVTDQGRGFDAHGRFMPPSGWGLAGMRERVESANGDFILRSTSGIGTEIEVVIPLKEK